MSVDFCDQCWASFSQPNLQTAQGLAQSKQWIKELRGVAQSAYDVSLQTFIRNKIHHPENATMQAIDYTSDELRQSIEEMIVLL